MISEGDGFIDVVFSSYEQRFSFKVKIFFVAAVNEFGAANAGPFDYLEGEPALAAGQVGFEQVDFMGEKEVGGLLAGFEFGYFWHGWY